MLDVNAEPQLLEHPSLRLDHQILEVYVVLVEDHRLDLPAHTQKNDMCWGEGVHIRNVVWRVRDKIYIFLFLMRPFRPDLINLRGEGDQYFVYKGGRKVQINCNLEVDA